MLGSWRGQKSGDEDTLEPFSARTTPRPSFSSPTETTQHARPSTDRPAKRTFPTAYTTPHDAVLAELQGMSPKPGSTDPSTYPASFKDQQLIYPEPDSIAPARESISPAPQQQPSRVASSDILLDPFDGSNLGILIPHGQGSESQTPSQINLLSNQEGGAITSNPVGSEAVWSHLSRVLDLQSEISKMHLEMETIGMGRGGVSGAGDWKGKRHWQGHKGAAENIGSTLNPEDPVVPPGLKLPRQRAMSTVSTISSTGEPEGDEPGVNVHDEEEEKSRIRGEEFAKLASQFEGRKQAIHDIMEKLGDLSKTLSEFHALPIPNIELPSSRGNSSGITSPPNGPSPQAELKTSRSSLTPAAATSTLTVQPPPLHRAKSDTAASIPTISTLQRKNVPTLLVNSVDPEKQHHVMDSPASTLGSLKLSPDE